MVLEIGMSWLIGILGGAPPTIAFNFKRFLINNGGSGRFYFNGGYIGM